MKTVQATVTSVRDGVQARVRRGHRNESVCFTYAEGVESIVESLVVGDRIEVERKVNSPYLYFVGKVD